MESRISSVSGIGVGMFATTPSAAMKPMICAFGVSPVALGQICCSVICDCTPVSVAIPDVRRSALASREAPRGTTLLLVYQDLGGGEGLGDGSGLGVGSGLGYRSGSGVRSGWRSSSVPLFGDMLIVTTLDTADWRARCATTVA